MLQPQPSVFVFIYPFALSNFIHTFYTSNDFSLTNSTYKISTSKQGKVLKNIYNVHKTKNFTTFFFTNLSRLRIVSMALWSSPGGCPALDTRPPPVTAVGEERPKSIFQT